MRLILALSLGLSLTTFSCKTANKSGNNSKVKDIESVKKLEMLAGNQPNGSKIAVIRCAAGWIDASGQTEFALPYEQIQSFSFDQLERTYCTLPLGSGNPGGGGGLPTPIPPPPPVGGGAVVKLGYYEIQSGSGCSSYFITPKTQGGFMKGVTVQCLDNDAVTQFTCDTSGTCRSNPPGQEFGYYDGGVIEISQSGASGVNYVFKGEQDVCSTKGGKRFQGHCWVFAAAPNLSCGEVCPAAQMAFDETGASKGTTNAFCHQLGQKFGMPPKNYDGASEGQMGCAYCTNQQGGNCSSSHIGVFNTGPSTAGQSKGHLRLFCPCK